MCIRDRLIGFGVNTVMVIAGQLAAAHKERDMQAIYAVNAVSYTHLLAMGMSHFKAMLYIIVPQALKNVIPEMCNTFVNNLKMTSVLNVIGVSELFLMAKTAGGAYYKYFESYIVISIIYFILCFVFNRVFSVIEKKLQGRSDYELATEYLENE